MSQIRRMLMTSLGESFKQKEYLQTFENAYFDTGIIGDENTEYELMCTQSSIGTTFFVLGARVAYLSNQLCVRTNGQIDYANYTPPSKASLVGEKLLVTGKYDDDRIKFYGKIFRILADSENSYSYTSYETAAFNTIYPIYMFACNNGGSMAFPMGAGSIMYYLKIWQSGILVRDFVPALDKNNVACAYDKVTKKFFYSPIGYFSTNIEPVKTIFKGSEVGMGNDFTLTTDYFYYSVSEYLGEKFLVESTAAHVLYSSDGVNISEIQIKNVAAGILCNLYKLENNTWTLISQFNAIGTSGWTTIKTIDRILFANLNLLDRTTLQLLAPKNQFGNFKKIYNIPSKIVSNATTSINICTLTDGTQFVMGRKYRISYECEFECTSYTSSYAQACIYNAGGFNYLVMGSGISSIGNYKQYVDMIVKAEKFGQIKIDIRYFVSNSLTLNMNMKNFLIEEVQENVW